MKTISAIASTTHVDRRGTRFAKTALDGMIKNIRDKYLPYTKHHDPNQLLGVVLYGEVFQLNDGEFALGVVAGEYENNADRKKYTVGTKNTEFDRYKAELDMDGLKLTQSINALVPDPIKPINQSKLSITELLALYLDYTRVNDAGQVYEIRQYVSKTDGLEIHVYPKDHQHQEHYHVISKQRSINARFNTKTHQLISTKSGRISQKNIKKIQAFFQDPNNAKLLAEIVNKMYN